MPWGVMLVSDISKKLQKAESYKLQSVYKAWKLSHHSI